MDDDLPRGARMKKTHSMGVEVIARGAGKHVPVRRGNAARRVERIAQEGMTRGREVNADLMSPARLDFDLYEREALAVLEETDAASRPLSRRAHGVDRAEEAMRHEADGVLENRLARGKSAGHQSAIASFDVVLPRTSKSAPRLRVEREKHDSRRSPSEPVEG
jgi:hypothetical protein